MNKVKARIFVSQFFSFILISLGQPAIACVTAEPIPEPSVAERVAASSYVFVGTVVAAPAVERETHSTTTAGGYTLTSESFRPLHGVVAVEVSQSFKGDAAGQVKMSGFNGMSCNKVVDVGDGGIFFASGDADGVLSAYRTGGRGSRDAMLEDSPENIAAVTAALPHAVESAADS